MSPAAQDYIRWVESQNPSLFNTQSHAVPSVVQPESTSPSLSHAPSCELISLLSPHVNHGSTAQVRPLNSESSTFPPHLTSPQIPGQPHLSDQEIEELLNMGTPAAFLVLYSHGTLSILSSLNGFHIFQCPNCDLGVKTSISSSITLQHPGQFTALANHYRQKQCCAALQRKEKDATMSVIQDLTSAGRLLVSTSFNASNTLIEPR